MNDERTALVVGAHGGIGQAMVQALRRHGWRVRALVRGVRPMDPAVEQRVGE